MMEMIHNETSVYLIQKREEEILIIVVIVG